MAFAILAGFLFGAVALLMYAFILIVPVLLAIPTAIVAMALAGKAISIEVGPGQPARFWRALVYGPLIGVVVLFNIGLPAIQRSGGPSISLAMGGSIGLTCALCVVLRYAEISLVKNAPSDGWSAPAHR